MRLPAFAFAVLLAASGALHAQSPAVRNPEADALRAALTALQQEQQSVYQQFQMVQGLRASGLPPPNAMPSYTPPPTPPNYDDLVRDRERTSARQSEYQAELQRLLRTFNNVAAEIVMLLRVVKG